MSRIRACAGLIVVAAWLGTVAVPAEALAIQPTGKTLQRWAPAYAGGLTFSATDAINVATQFDLVAAYTNQLKSFVTVMKLANPFIVLIAYQNATLVDSSSLYADSWYAHDAAGNKIYSTQGHQWLMDVSNPSWSQAVSDTCAGNIAFSLYDGCFLDVLGVAPLLGNYLNAKPINPATNQVWTQSDWLNATTAIASKTRTDNAGKLIMGNGLGNGQRYFDRTAPSEKLLDGLDGGGAEQWIRDPTAPVTKYKTETQWKQDVDMLADAEARGAPVLTGTKLLTTATQAQKDAWHKYSLASFLLDTSGVSYFSYFQDTDPHTPTADNPWDHVDVGTPSGPYAKIGGVYQRSFSKGLAIVNPTTATVTVSLGGTYKNLDGVTVTSVTMAPNTGDVFTTA